jgi:cytochrome c peroxidase
MLQAQSLVPLVFVTSSLGLLAVTNGTDTTKTSAPAAATAPAEGRATFHVDLSKVTMTPPTDLSAEPVQTLPSIEDVFDNLEFEYSKDRVDLGRRLFHDTRLSTDNSISCASCHDLRYAGIDRAPTATGIRGQIGPVNTPTVFNAALSIAQFWDGRAESLAKQAGGPPLAAGEMGSSWPEIVSKLIADISYVEQFQKAFPDQVKSPADVQSGVILDAIASFEATLITPDSRFDQWLGGDEKAITLDERKGYELFKAVGCGTCHYGPHAGGRTFQRLGAKREFFTDADRTSHVDMGRFNVTKDERDKHVFKVPSLRNVAATGPWFHDGSRATLDDAVRAMAYHQLDVKLDDEDVGLIVQFLGTLTGKYEGHYLDEGLNRAR